MNKKKYEPPALEVTKFQIKEKSMAGFFPEETMWDGNIVEMGPSFPDPTVGTFEIHW